MDKGFWSRPLRIATSAFNELMFWAMLDLMPAVLPIALLVLVDYMFLGNEQSRVQTDFWAIPEWSFASIVLLGASLRDVLRLKLTVQKTSARNLQAMLSVIVFLLIFATSLLIAIYSERGGAKIDLDFIGQAQQAVFFLTVWLFVMAYLAMGIDVKKPTTRLAIINRLLKNTPRGNRLCLSEAGTIRDGKATLVMEYWYQPDGAPAPENCVIGPVGPVTNSESEVTYHLRSAPVIPDAPPTSTG